MEGLMKRLNLLFLSFVFSCSHYGEPVKNPPKLLSKETKFIKEMEKEVKQASLNDVRNPAGLVKRPKYGYKLVWSDEFNGAQEAIRNGEDPSCFDSKVPQCKRNYWWVTDCNKDMQDPRNQVDLHHPEKLNDLNKCVWSVFHGAHGDGSKAVSTFDINMVEVKNGNLVLHNKKNYNTYSEYDCGLPSYDQDMSPIYSWFKHYSGRCKFIKGAVDTKPVGSRLRGFVTKYGRVEVRAILPDSPGSWPAHWMMPGDDSAVPEEYKGWPEAGEIDIMEMWMSHYWDAVATYHNGDQKTGTHYWKGREWKAKRKYYPHLKSRKARRETFIRDYHTYAVEWEEDELRFYVDNYLVNRVVDGEIANKRYRGYLGRYNIPKWPFHIILNNNITNIGKKKDYPSDSNWKDSVHLIDYVRVYQPCSSGDENCKFFNETYRSKNKCPSTMKSLGNYLDGTPICKSRLSTKIKKDKCVAKGHFIHDGNCLINKNGKYFKARPLKDAKRKCPVTREHVGDYVDGLPMCKHKLATKYTKRKCNGKGGITFNQYCLRIKKNQLFYKAYPLKDEVDGELKCKMNRKKVGEKDGMPVCKVWDKIKRKRCEKKHGGFFTGSDNVEYCIIRSTDWYKAKKIK
jgi:hypothetical protein